MPDDSLWNLQKAVFGTLSAHAPLTGLLADGADGVFDHVPAGSLFPYIVIGDVSARPFDITGGRDAVVTVRSFSRGHGMKELKEIMAAIFGALHETDFAVDGHMLVLCREMALDCVPPDADGTRQGVQRFRIITEPA